MRVIRSCYALSLLSFASFLLSSCSYYSGSPSTQTTPPQQKQVAQRNFDSSVYEARLPQHIASTEKVVVVDPRVHAWGAYQDGTLVKAGIAVAGADWCPDLGRRCHTATGTFHVNSLGSPGCKSSIYPKPHGGAPMPHCMFFNGNQALHGSYPGQLADANLSHGCVRLHIPDAEWLRYNFVRVGTKVVVKPY